jgi:hypothetical protein
MGESLMEFFIVPRLGIGFDIEHNDTICHVVGDDEEKFIGAYEGLIVKLPFVALYWGEFSKFDDKVLD